MRLAGMDGIVAHGREETALAVREAVAAGDIAILAITEKAAESIPDLVNPLKEHGELPILVEIPDRHGTKRSSDFLMRYVQDAIGVKMD
jgi:V/A-type H+-transporting ATPase subunit F